jgi:hypothetical protein
MKIPISQKQKIENNSEAAYRIMAHLKMVDLELEAMRDGNIQDVKKILSEASKYYEDTLKRRLKRHFDKENMPLAYDDLVSHAEHERMVSLQAVFALLFDCKSRLLEYFYEQIIKLQTHE